MADDGFARRLRRGDSTVTQYDCGEWSYEVASRAELIPLRPPAERADDLLRKLLVEPVPWPGIRRVADCLGLAESDMRRALARAHGRTFSARVGQRVMEWWAASRTGTATLESTPPILRSIGTGGTNEKGRPDEGRSIA